MPRVYSHPGFLKILLLAALFSFFFSLPAITEAVVTVNSDITSNTTWTEANDPYIIEGNVTVPAGVTLTINAGTVVKFLGANSLNINGTLRINGTAAKKVHFTSFNDDSVGGDTNGDGNASKPAKGDWGSIVLGSAGSVAIINHAVIRYAGSIYVPDVAPAIYNIAGKLTVSNTEITNAKLFGIGQLAGSLKVSSSTISKSEIGVGVKGGSAELIGNILEHNQVGVVDDGDNTLKLVGNIFRNNNMFPVEFYPNRQRSFIQLGNTAYGNYYNGIVLLGWVDQTFSLPKNDTLPYVVSGFSSDRSGGRLSFRGEALEILPTGVLKIPAGSIVKFPEGSGIKVAGLLTASGSAGMPVVFTSVLDDTYGGDTWDVDEKRPVAGDGGSIQVAKGGTVTITRTLSRYGGRFYPSMFQNDGGSLSVTYSNFEGSASSGVIHNSGTTVLKFNTIANHFSHGVKKQGSGTVDARYNYWGDPTGPHHPVSNPVGRGEMVSDGVQFGSWLKTPHEGTVSAPCCSSILFLPGLMGTRLYEGSTKRWEPSLFSTDVKRLHLDVEGKSIQRITASTVIDEFVLSNSTLDLNIYKSFLSDLNQQKQSGRINDYSTYGYDWRLSLTDILADGKLADKLRELAKSSKTGKVTIVAHSNGGLLAKALLNQVGHQDSSNLVDSLVLVGVPQVGTPNAMGALLHGYDSGIPKGFPFLVPEDLARDFVKNMSAAYNVLPNGDYFSVVGVPLTSFISGKLTDQFINAYGFGIHTLDEMHRFIRGDEGRNSPSYSNLAHPSKVNSVLLDKSLREVQAISRQWNAPAPIKSYQIAGVGEETLLMTEYSTENNKIISTPFRTIDGDGTVVEPSALAMSTSSHRISRWWLNLLDYNNDSLVNARHGNIFEVPSLRTFIFDYVTGNSPAQSFDYIASKKYNLTGPHKISFILHSPLTLSYTESDGEVVNEQNPLGKHAKFSRYGEVQIIDVYNSDTGTIKLDGLASGEFTLKVEETKGNMTLASTTYAAVPTTEKTKAEIQIRGQNLLQTSALVIDYEGDGKNDFSLSPAIGGRTTLQHAISLSPAANKLLEQLSDEILLIAPLSSVSSSSIIRR